MDYNTDLLNVDDYLGDMTLDAMTLDAMTLDAKFENFPIMPEYFEQCFQKSITEQDPDSSFLDEVGWNSVFDEMNKLGLVDLPFDVIDSEASPSPTVSSTLRADKSPATMVSPVTCEPVGYLSAGSYLEEFTGWGSSKNHSKFNSAFMYPNAEDDFIDPMLTDSTRTVDNWTYKPIDSPPPILATKKHVHDDHSYSAPPLLQEIKIEVQDSEEDSPLSGFSSEPDVETVLNSDDDDAFKKQQPRVPKKEPCTRKRKGRKPKNAQPAKRARVGRPRTAKNVPAPYFCPEELEAAVKQSRRRNTRRNIKVTNSVETTPPSSENSVDSLDLKLNEEKRANHNLAEKQRRQNLAVLLTNLRKSVPVIADDEKASKVRILKQAEHLASTLTRQSVAMEKLHKALLAKHQILLKCLKGKS